MDKYKLTEFSHGAGCGCKISPKILTKILEKKGDNGRKCSNLLVGNETRDDAAVIDNGDGTATISTTDFFMPIVDDPFDFGRIASVNAMSDVYAMGGIPTVAIAILGWPINELPAHIANRVVEGARQSCREAGIPLAGGHSIDSPEPIFGLAVTGRVNIENLKRNSEAKPGDLLFLTKPLGVGILSTAQKKKKLRKEHSHLGPESMVQLNSIGSFLGSQQAVSAMTDVTGFGLLGHLSEMCEASGCSAVINSEKVPLLDEQALNYYLEKKCIPGGTHRNWDSYGHSVSVQSEKYRLLFCDPQTSGGILFSVDPEMNEQIQKSLNKEGFDLQPIGELQRSRDKLIVVI